MACVKAHISRNMLFTNGVQTAHWLLEAVPMASMELKNQFTVSVAAARAWELLNDLPAIAPCMPGATLREVRGDEYLGDMTVKVGPITAKYAGTATFTEIDEDERRVTILASGNGNQGAATATITATLRPAGDDETVVDIDTALDLSGRIAQFGRSGAMVEVSERMIERFLANLEQQVLATGTAEETASGDNAPDETLGVDLLELAGGSPTLRRAAAAGVVVAAAVALVVLLRRRSRRPRR